MKPQIPTFSLSDGILLEDSGALLPWGVTRDEAWKIANASHANLPDDYTRVKWEERMIGGVSCGLLAYFPDSSTLDHVTIWMRLPEKSYHKPGLYPYCFLFDHLLSVIGPPTWMRSGAGGLYAPILTWDYDGCTMQLYTGERMGDFTSLEINRGKSPRFERTNQEAEQDATGNPYQPVVPSTFSVTSTSFPELNTRPRW